jgi:hypothetical protein
VTVAPQGQHSTKVSEGLDTWAVNFAGFGKTAKSGETTSYFSYTLATEQITHTKPYAQLT